MTRFQRTAVMVLALSVIAFTAGCSDQVEITYVDSGRALESTGLQEEFADIEEPGILGRPVADAPELRHGALASLRSQGAAQADLANLLTEVLPSNSRSVPYFAEEATVDGRDAWVVIEVWGPEGGTLDRNRAWVFDRTNGQVIVSTTFR